MKRELKHVLTNTGDSNFNFKFKLMYVILKWQTIFATTFLLRLTIESTRFKCFIPSLQYQTALP